MILEKLRAVRISHNLNYQNMADKLEFSKTFYWQIENGHRKLSYANALKIASIFEMRPDELFWEEFDAYKKSVAS